MGEQDEEVVIPIVREELHADAVPVPTGGVRVTKGVQSHDEIIEQELRKSHVEVKRVKTDRIVDGPQPVQRVGNTLIVPVVSEVLRVEKQWVVTEEIHITQTQERETVQNKVTLNREEARIERVDASGNVIGSVNDATGATVPDRPASIVQRASVRDDPSKRRTLGRSRSMLRNTKTAKD